MEIKWLYEKINQRCKTVKAWWIAFLVILKEPYTNQEIFPFAQRGQWFYCNKNATMINYWYNTEFAIPIFGLPIYCNVLRTNIVSQKYYSTLCSIHLKYAPFTQWCLNRKYNNTHWEIHRMEWFLVNLWICVGIGIFWLTIYLIINCEIYCLATLYMYRLQIGFNTTSLLRDSFYFIDLPTFPHSLLWGIIIRIYFKQYHAVLYKPTNIPEKSIPT